MCGKRICCGFLFLLLTSVAAHGQEIRLQRSLLPVTDASTAHPALGQYNVVAVMVEFQPDTSRFTTGDGTFSGTLFRDGLAPSIDPLPHDNAYFQAHLDFLSDYISTVSDNKASVVSYLVPEIVRISQTMDAYSPIGPASDSDEEVAKLAALVDEVWSQADLISDIDLSLLDPERTAFMIFHAGVGRDIELIGTTLDKTPFDLPSLYFSEEALTRLRPNQRPQFNGLVVTSTMIIPRTESRVGEDFINDSAFLAEFSINGLMAASFLNYLGVPDLFDTVNGTSVIGPFGLMDPLGIFAYNGLLPPEPSAWTKVFLGWADPVNVGLNVPIELQAVASSGTSQVARIDVSSSEYFLVENRNRDPEGDGLRMQVLKDGQVAEYVVQFDDEDFNSTNVEGFEGVLVAADNYDWALPGGADSDGVDRQGGILVWHIDQGVISSRLDSNSINTDRSHLGVDLEEADGASDLGFPQSNPFAPAFDLGTPFDYFYEGNPVTVITASGTEVALYENRFAGDTHPNSNNNLGGPSFVQLDNFTAPGQTMSFVYSRQEGSVVRLRDSFQSPTLQSETVHGGWVSVAGSDGENDRWLAIQHARAGGVDVLDAQTGSLVATYPSGISTVTADGNLAIVSVGSDTELAIAVLEDDEETRYLIDLPPSAIAAALIPPVISLSDDSFAVRFINDSSNGVLILNGVSASVAQADIATADVLGIAAEGDGIIVVGKDGLDVPGAAEDRPLNFASGSGPATIGLDESGYVVVAADTVNAVLQIDAPGIPELTVDLNEKLSLSQSTAVSPYPLLVDLDSDGHLEVLLDVGGTIAAFTKTGALVDGFPLNTGIASVTRPLVRRDENDRISILVSGVDGYLRSFSRGVGETRWTLDEGYPLSVGLEILATPTATSTSLYAVSGEGDVYAFEQEEDVEVASGHHWILPNGANFAVSVDPGSEPPSSLLDPTETYNWPNPVREHVTNFRVRVNEPASVEILIIDRAGNEIQTIEMGSVPRDVPTEIAWQPDVASGIYYARVRATSDNGSTAERIIKVAVIR